MVGESIGNDQFTVVNNSAARIDNVRHVTFTFVLIGYQQRLAQPTDYSPWVVTIQKESADAVGAQGTNTVTENQPPGIGFNGRATVPNLDELPRESRLQQFLALMPEVDIIRE